MSHCCCWPDQEMNRKRGRRDHNRINRYSSGNTNLNTLSRRGDQTVIHGDCDGNYELITYILILFTYISLQNYKNIENLLRSMNDLIALVKKLEKDISNQHGDIRRLQSLIENCASCWKLYEILWGFECTYIFVFRFSRFFFFVTALSLYGQHFPTHTQNAAVIKDPFFIRFCIQHSCH